MGCAFRAIAILALGWASILAGCARFEPGRMPSRGPEAVGGFLDLRGWDFAAQGAVNLAGQWDFASGFLLDSKGATAPRRWETRSVPDFWTHPEGGDRPGTGAGTYRLRIILPADAAHLAIRYTTGMNAFELEVNGGTVARVGKPALQRSAAISSYRPGVSPVEARNGALDILVRVSNHEYRSGGMWRVLTLGDRGALVAAQQKSIYISIALNIAVATLALNSLIIFAFRRKDRSYLFFGIFGLIVALRPLVTDEYALTLIFPSIPFNLLVRLEYATAMLAIPAAMAFVLWFFPSERRKAWGAALLLPFAPFALFDLFLPLYWLTWTIFAFYAVAIVMMVIAVVAVLARAVYRRTPGGRSMFAGGCLVGVCAINDILYATHVVDTGYLLPYSLAFFIFLQSLVLARRFTGAFDEAEHLSAELGDANAMLKEEIQKAMFTSARLEESLVEKEVLLKEVHHRVKNSIQIVSSIVSLQAHRSNHREVEAMARSIKERIRVISLANEKLYDIDSGDRIDLLSYARDLVRLTVSSYEAEDCRIEGVVQGRRIEAESGVCIDFGLVLTEFVVNAIKHALVPKGGGRVLIAIAESGGVLSFEVRDDGPGFPQGFEPERTESLGIKIVRALLQRREGTLAFSKGPGAVVSCSMSIAG
jgi:two-component sensor histidine kinase